MDINEAFEKELKKSKIMKGNASQGKKEAIREIAKRFHTAGYKEGRVEFAEKIKEALERTEYSASTFLSVIRPIIRAELKKAGE